MTKTMLAVAVMSVIAMPSCMHRVDQILHARAASKAMNDAALGLLR